MEREFNLNNNQSLQITNWDRGSDIQRCRIATNECYIKSLLD